MCKLSISYIEEIEQRRVEAMLAWSGEGDHLEYTRLVEQEIPRLIADNKRLRLELNKLAGAATKAAS
jgi:hypothetical protein